MAAGQLSARRVVTGLVLGAVLVAVVTAAIEGLRQVVPLLSLPILYLFAIFPLAIWWGAWLALAASAASMLTFDYLYVAPVHSLGISSPGILLALVLSGLTSFVVAELAKRARRTREAELLAENLRQAEEKTRRIAAEQAALRRVATYVARADPPSALFAAVAEETGRLLGADFALIGRCDPDEAVTSVASWSSSGDAVPAVHVSIGGRNLTTLVARTARPARLDDYADTSGEAAQVAREWKLRSSVGAPISVGGRLWGVILVASAHEAQLPADTEERLAGFAELAATAIANADARAALTASRARIVTTADETRRRIERNLHDGVQQRLVSLALAMRGAESKVPPALPEVRAALAQTAEEVVGVVTELQEISRGIHPAILSHGGLAAALPILARRSAVPVTVSVRAERRPPEPVEVAAYYVVAEALANVVKHAQASGASVDVDADPDALRLRIRDDGIGGAAPGRGSGLVGITDRVEALGGKIVVDSPPGEGTSLQVVLPLAV
jgi:signal transduction histidine kinase